MILLYVDSRTDNSLCLHLCDFGICYRKTATTVTHHRVEFVERSDKRLYALNALALCCCEKFDISFFRRNELMERRIKESDANGGSFKSFVKSFKVALLIRKYLFKSSFSFFNCVRTNHFTESVNSVALKEHMLCAAKTDTLCAEFSCFPCVSGSVGICADSESSELICPSHDSAEFACYCSVNSSDSFAIDIACCTVDGDNVAFVECSSCEFKLLVFFIHLYVAATGNTACSHSACNNGCVACHTATNREYTLSCLHTRDIFGRSFETNKNDLLAGFLPFNSIFCREYNLSASCAGRCAETFAERCCCFECLCIELRVKKCVKVSGVDHCNCFFGSSHTLVNKVASDLESSLSRSLTVTCLEHVQLAVFNGELHVLHVTIVSFKSFAYVFELNESFGEFLFHFSYLHRCTNAGNNVFALCVCKEFTKESLSTRSGVTCECNACTAVVAHVTERHHLYVYCCTP